MYMASVIADSISGEGHRITTVRVVYPHAVHKDMLRHRAFNRSVESFRAQPPEKILENLRSGHAFKPDVFAVRTKGMGQGEGISDQEAASLIWDGHVVNVCRRAEDFLRMGIAKQQVNFLLQDICPLTEIITATDWSNFFALRTELNNDGTPVARPEVYNTAIAIQDAIEGSVPQVVTSGLHLPFITEDEFQEIARRHYLGYSPGSYEVEGYWVQVSAGRCARISYGDYDWRSEDRERSAERAHRLMDYGHMSPFEHQAKPFSKHRWKTIQLMRDVVSRSSVSTIEAEEMCRQLEYSGNLHGWVPARKMIPNEWDYSLLNQNFDAE